MRGQNCDHSQHHVWHAPRFVHIFATIYGMTFGIACFCGLFLLPPNCVAFLLPFGLPKAQVTAMEIDDKSTEPSLRSVCRFVIIVPRSLLSFGIHHSGAGVVICTTPRPRRHSSADAYVTYFGDRRASISVHPRIPKQNTTKCPCRRQTDTSCDS